MSEGGYIGGPEVPASLHPDDRLVDRNGRILPTRAQHVADSAHDAAHDDAMQMREREEGWS